MKGEFLRLYFLNSVRSLSIPEAVQDLFRTSTATDDLEDPRSCFANCQYSLQLQYAEQKTMLPISKALSDIDLDLNAERTKAGN